MSRPAIRHVALFCLLALLTPVHAADKATANTSLTLVREFEGGRLYKADKLNVLELHGSYRRMGRQEGGLLKDLLRRFHAEAIIGRFVRKQGLSLEVLRGFSSKRFDLYPERFKAILQGMAETSGMKPDDLMMMDCIWSFSHLAPAPHCSAVAAWGEYTGGRPLVVGRNLDYFSYFKDFAEFLTLVVYNPDDGIPTASFGYAGQIATLNGMNKAGLFLESNDGSLSGGLVYYTNRPSATILSLAFLFDCSTMAGLDGAINAARAHYSFILNVADKEAACCYEWPTFDLRRRAPDRPGLLVATNHFVDPSWGLGLPQDSATRSLHRRQNLLTLAEKYKGRFHARTMMEVLDIPFDRGGATWPDRTIYQMVAVPQELKLWLKAPGLQDWVQTDLEKLFIGRQ